MKTHTESRGSHTAWCKYCNGTKAWGENRSLIMSAEMEHHYIMAWWKIPFCIGSKYRQRRRINWRLNDLGLGNVTEVQNKKISCHCLWMVFTLGAFQMSREDKKQLKPQAKLFPQTSDFSIQFKQLLLLLDSLAVILSNLICSSCLFFSLLPSLLAAVSSSSSMCPWRGGPERWWQHGGWIVEITY